MATNKNPELRELKKDAKDTVDNAKDKASEIAGLTKNEIARMAKEAGSNVSHFLAEKKDQAVAAREKTEEAIVANPFRSIAIAAVGGLLLGALLRRK